MAAYHIKRNGQYANLDNESWEVEPLFSTEFETIEGAQEYINHLGLENAFVVFRE
jgi:hypothetical protein